MGKIIELVKGNDGVIRGAKLRTTKPEGGATSLARPLQHLFALEISNRNQDKDDNTKDVHINTRYEKKMADGKQEEG